MRSKLTRLMDWMRSMTTTRDEMLPSPWATGHRGEPAQSAREGQYDLYEDVIVKLRFDGALTKAQQHAQCQRIWDAARSFTLSMHSGG